MTIFGRQRKIQALSFECWLAVAAALLIGACQTTKGGSAGSAERAWLYGMHRVPTGSLQDGQFYSLAEIRKNPADWQRQVGKTKLKPGTKIPAVIYLHGCAGNTAGDRWASKFSKMGYAFFAPDSLARPRRSLCWTGDMDYRISLRREELNYALRQLRKSDWIDQKRIILTGSSEGAQAASDYGGKEFAGIVLSATDCRFSGGSPNAPSNVPVLNMVGANDTKGGGMGCRISRTIGGSRHLRIKGAGHKLPGYSQAREALEQFLKECCG